MENVLEKYKTITSIDISLFLDDFNSFINNKYQSIANYYSGESITIDKSVLDMLEELNNRAIQISDSFSIFADRLSDDFYFWELLDTFEEIKEKIKTIINSATWYRSNKTLYFNNRFESDYILKQNQTLPKLAEDLGFDDPNNDWVDIALKNSLREEDYSLNGGSLLKITFQSGLDVKINSILGGISGVSVYGKDIDRSFVFEVDENDFIDFKMVTNKDCIIQSYFILLNTVKGSVPEFPDDGINKDIIGGNVNSIQYPILFRQLINLFAKDDTFKSFQINNIDRDQDVVVLDVQATTRIGEVLNERLTAV